MSLEFHDSVVLIESKEDNNRRFGTGFIIYQDKQITYLLTCSHVVEDVGGIEKVKAAGESATVIAFDGSDGFDLAVLRIDSLFIKKPLDLGRFAEKGNTFKAVGYKSYDGKRFLREPIRGKLGEQVVLQSKLHIEPILAWYLKIDEEYSLQPGNSGSPVIDEASGKVLGVVRSSPKRRKGVSNLH
jgi:S1-C subfamily serine protease